MLVRQNVFWSKLSKSHDHFSAINIRQNRYHHIIHLANILNSVGWIGVGAFGDREYLLLIDLFKQTPIQDLQKILTLTVRKFNGKSFTMIISIYICSDLCPTIFKIDRSHRKLTSLIYKLRRQKLATFTVSSHTNHKQIW